MSRYCCRLKWVEGAWRSEGGWERRCVKEGATELLSTSLGLQRSCTSSGALTLVCASYPAQHSTNQQLADACQWLTPPNLVPTFSGHSSSTASTAPSQSALHSWKKRQPSSKTVPQPKSEAPMPRMTSVSMRLPDNYRHYKKARSPSRLQASRASFEPRANKWTKPERK